MLRISGWVLKYLQLYIQLTEDTDRKKLLLIHIREVLKIPSLPAPKTYTFLSTDIYKKDLIFI